MLNPDPGWIVRYRDAVDAIGKVGPLLITARGWHAMPAKWSALPPGRETGADIIEVGPAEMAKMERVTGAEYDRLRALHWPTAETPRAP